ncbi:MAG: hypothetical protein QOD65_1314 [Gaiellales bacterium]|nr:hypothetical protein [Gaiellales bacterium]
MNVLLWHVHGSYTTAFVQGAHTYLVPVLPGRPPSARGKPAGWGWPESVIEVTPEEAREHEIDVVVLQRPEELAGGATAFLGREPGIGVPAIYLEHSTPQGRVAEMQHPAADRSDLLVVHVTQFNALFWDCGSTSTRVIEHGIPDPGYRYSGVLERAICLINEPARRTRVTGTDLVAQMRRRIPLSLYGINSEAAGGDGELQPAERFDDLARHRVYFHPYRWTSLGLSLIEAMQVGMPVVALATTEAPAAIPAGAGVVSNDLVELERGLRSYLAEPEAATAAGRVARAAALERYGLDRFLADWDAALHEVAA